MVNLDTTIGVLCTGYETTYLCTIKELKEELNSSCYYDSKKYCDFRYSTNLLRFNFDPYTGEKIDWKVVKTLLDG
jgi:hypothetical protein